MTTFLPGSERPTSSSATDRLAFLQALLDSLSDAIVAWDPQSRIAEWNKGAEETFGYTRAEALGQKLDRLIRSPVPGETARLGRRLALGRRPVNLETTRFRKDGVPVAMTLSAAPIKSGTEARGSVAVYKDISTWKAREQRLRQTTRLLRAIGEINKLIIHARDGDDLLRSACRILGAHGRYSRVQAVTLTTRGQPLRFHGYGRELRRATLRPCAVRVLENRRSLFIPNVAKSSRCRSCTLQAPGWAACFLLSHEDRVYGLLQIASPESAFDQAQEITFLEETAGNLGHALHSLQEQQDRDRMSVELRNLKEFNENIVRSLAEGIIIKSTKGLITFVNPTLEKLLGYGPGELLGRHWKAIVDPREKSRIAAKTKKRPTATQDKYESVLLSKAGARVPVLLAAQSIFDRGRYKGVLTAVTDIRELKDYERRLLESQKQLYELATKDGLTGQWNRASILKFLAEELDHGARERYPTSVIMIDVDNFKKANDASGHLVGDRILRTMTACPKTHLRPYDRIGRYGGDEVLLVLPHCSLTKAASIAERLRSACAKTVLRVRGGTVRFTLSLGCSSSGSFANPSVDKLIRAADRALYEAKKGGRDRVAVAFRPRRGAAARSS
jgi:diguanylate cyclase (GGDEF)-like protein/PAS domain S-box-containing protein